VKALRIQGKSRQTARLIFILCSCAYSQCFMIGLNPVSYEQRIRDSWIWKELHKVRNIRPSFNTSLGMYGGLLYTGTVWYLTRGNEPWTLNLHSSKGLFF